MSKFKIFKCGQCGLQSTLPSPSFYELKEYYTKYFDFRADREVLIKNAEHHLEALKPYGIDNNTKILDFGAGTGIFLDTFDGLCIGYDPFSKKKKDLFSDLKEITDNDFDIVTSWGVVDNLVDPIQSLSEASSFLKSNGLLSFTVVSNELEMPFRYKPPEHLTYWTKDSVKLLVKKLGFEVLLLEQDSMFQKSDVYIDLICHRVPPEYHKSFSKINSYLPDFVKAPTNELLCIARKV